MTASLSYSDTPQNPQLQAILTGVQDRMAERQAAIQAGNLLVEKQADKEIPQGLHDAADACPDSSPAAKQGFQNAANKYSESTSRAERDNVVLHIVKNILIKQGLHAILLGAGVMTITLLATPATILYNGAEVGGGMIDNGDGTSEFTYDDNGDGWVDHQFTIDNTTEEPVSEAESLDLEGVIKGVWHIVENLF
ncbi:hypothetical protein FRC07_006444 [Ceratobasidium sp. 392]|nr:hypothetical protein FRC07_006444 [Ceratobasidium sp. 392]